MLLRCSSTVSVLTQARYLMAGSKLTLLSCRGVMGISLSDLIDQGAKWVLVSNYMIDMVWLLSAVPALLSAEQLVFVHGQATTERSKSCWQVPTLLYRTTSTPDNR